MILTVATAITIPTTTAAMTPAMTAKQDVSRGEALRKPSL